MRVGTALRRSALLGAAIGACAPASPALAVEREYELATEGLDRRVALSAAALRPASVDGNTVCFVATVAISEQIPDGLCAHRGGSGWQTEWVTQPALGVPASDQFGPKIRFVSDDGVRQVFMTGRQVLPEVPVAEPRVMQGFLRAAGETRWVTGPSGLSPAGTTDGYQPRVPAAASADLTHVLFQTEDRVLASDTNADLDVYEWANGTTRLVSRDADGNAVGGSLAGAGGLSPAIGGSINRAGTRVFFHSNADLTPGAEPGVQNVYMREGDAVRLVSPRRNAADPPAEPISFAGAADDGSVLYLTTAEQLTDEPKQPGDAIYRYDLGADDLSLVATGDGIRALGVSADGSSVFYMLTAGSPQLWVDRGNGSTQIGTLFPTDAAFPYHVASPIPLQRGLRISRDGSTAVFVSQSPALAGGPGGMPQAYRWEAGVGVTRLATTQTGSAPSAASIGNFGTLFPMFPGDRFRGETTMFGDGQGLYGRAMSENGGTAFFDTAEALLPEDTNGRVDVYEWRAGELGLVSSGKSEDDSFYLDNSADAGTVFFLTAEALDPRDKNAVRDVYAARVGGGFPAPEPSSVGAPAPGAGAGSPGTPAGPSTTTPEPTVIPPADPPDDTPGPGGGPGTKPVKVRVFVNRVELEGRRVSIPMRASADGRARVVVRHDGRRVGRGTGTLEADENGIVVVRLSRKAAKRLPAGRDAELRLVVRFRPEEGRSVRAREQATVAVPEQAARPSRKRRAGNEGRR